jgi:hypothetical protein
MDVNKYGCNVYQPPKWEYRRQEVMQLTRMAIEVFDRPWEYMNDRQLSARETLLKWARGRSIDLHSKSEWSETATFISSFEMRQLRKNFNELLFGDHIAESEFRWIHDNPNF